MIIPLQWVTILKSIEDEIVQLRIKGKPLPFGEKNNDRSNN